MTAPSTMLAKWLIKLVICVITSCLTQLGSVTNSSSLWWMTARHSCSNWPLKILALSWLSRCINSRRASRKHRKSIKDKHIKGQDRYCNHKRFNNAFMMHASTSPFYPLFAALDVNAKMHEGASGRYLWREAVKPASKHVSYCWKSVNISSHSCQPW